VENGAPEVRLASNVVRNSGFSHKFCGAHALPRGSRLHAERAIGGIDGDFALSSGVAGTGGGEGDGLADGFLEGGADGWEGYGLLLGVEVPHEVEVGVAVGVVGTAVDDLFGGAGEPVAVFVVGGEADELFGPGDPKEDDVSDAEAGELPFGDPEVGFVGFGFFGELGDDECAGEALVLEFFDGGEAPGGEVGLVGADGGAGEKDDGVGVGGEVDEGVFVAEGLHGGEHGGGA